MNTALLTTVALIAAVALFRGVRAERGQWGSAATFCLVVPVLCFLSMAIGQWTGSIVHTYDVFGDHVTITPPWLSAVERGTTVLLMVLGLGWTLSFLSRPAKRRLNVAILPMLIIVGISAVSATVHSAGGVLNRREIVVILLLCAVGFLPRDRGAMLGFATFGVGLGVLSGLLTLVNSAEAYRDCRIDKCGVLHTLLLGATTDENILGLTMAVSVPFVYLAFHGRIRSVLTSFVALMVIFSGSRTALYGLIATLVAIIIFRAHERRGTRNSSAAATVMLGAGLLGSLVFPYLVNNDGAYSGRGLLWRVARTEVEHGGLLFGFGARGWAINYENGSLTGTPSYGPHNLFLLTAFDTGFIGLGLLLVALAILWSAAGERRMQLFLLLTPVIFCGTLEQPWSIDTLTWGTPAMLALFAASPHKRVAVAPLSTSERSHSSSTELADERRPPRTL